MLPKSIFFSDRRKISATNSNLELSLKHLPKNSAIIIREYDLNSEDREILAKKIIALARPLGLTVLVGKDLSLAKKIKADGVHFSDLDKLPLQFFKQKSFNKKFIFSISCHSFQSVLKVRKLKPDIIFISPIFPTSSHLNTKNIGYKKLAEYLTKISLKTKSHAYCEPSFYALGGINSLNLLSIRKLNLSGFGAISLFLNHS